MQRDMLSAAAVAAVGMWATLSRCPSCPQPWRRQRRCPRRPWGAVGERLVWAPVIVEGHPRCDPGARLATIGIAFQVDVFVLQAAPQALDEHVVHPAAAAVHRDLDTGAFERAGEGHAGELAALVGVEDLR